jgi:hypothetical protein
MGTRSLIVAISNGQHKLAQYGHLDGYPGGQGLRALRFCRSRLRDQSECDRFTAQLQLVRFVSQDEKRGMWRAVGVSDDETFATREAADQFNLRWPYLTQEYGAGTLEMVWHAKGPVLVEDAINFAGHYRSRFTQPEPRRTSLAS